MGSDDAHQSGAAGNRSKRVNAGSKMSRLLEEEDEDEFYKTTYGGFIEEADDGDYQSEESNSDVTDSDIDINEDDEVKSDVENDKDLKEKKKIVSIYKDPKKQSKQVEPAQKPKLLKVEKPASRVEIVWEKKFIRKSTMEKSKCTEGLLKQREAKAALVKMSGEKRKVPEYRRLTQEELLAEAKITEEINLASLETYQKMELEKKRVRSHRQVNSGPTIKFHSLTMPIDYLGDVTVETISDLKKESKDLPASEKCSKNFVTFTNEETFEKNFPSQQPPSPVQKKYCVVTGLPAKYFDPLTQLPYATVDGFKTLRAAYRHNALDKGNLPKPLFT